MKNISVMIKPASSLCNLRCRYCFYADVSEKRELRSFGIMQEDTAKKIIHNVFKDLEKGDFVTFAFQGGEPTLAGLDFFRFFADKVNEIKGEVNVSYAIQTNGILLDEDWCHFLKEQNYLVGLSWDAMQSSHDENRVDAGGEGTYDRVAAAKMLLDKYRVEYNVLTVLTNSLARRPQQVWRFLCKENIRYVQFIPCLGELEEDASGYSLTPERFASFYAELFKLWIADYVQGQYRSIKLFDDVINLLAFGVCNACGLTGHCMPQIVVEADGSVYPCDFYALDEYRVGNLAEESIGTLYEKSAMTSFRTRQTELLSLCKTCPFIKICGGGCPRMRKEVCGTQDANSCGYRAFLNTCLPQMQRIAQWERKARMQ